MNVNIVWILCTIGYVNGTQQNLQGIRGVILPGSSNGSGDSAWDAFKSSS